MSDSDRGAIWQVLGVIAVAAVACVPITGKPQAPNNWGDLGYAWANFVYNYQTLIAGFMAVGAAYVTLKQMQASDRLQDQRQRRQMAGDRWREKIAANRLVNRLTPQLLMLDSCSTRIQYKLELDAFIYAANRPLSSNGWTEDERNDYFILLFEANKLRIMVSEIPEAEINLLTYQADDTLKQLRQVLELAKLTMRLHRPENYVPYPADAPPWIYDGEAAAILFDAIQMASTFLKTLHIWHTQFLEDLGEEAH